jgi:hypothetical protein
LAPLNACINAMLTTDEIVIHPLARQRAMSVDVPLPAPAHAGRYPKSGGKAKRGWPRSPDALER